jgi:hypothetical protein
MFNYFVAQNKCCAVWNARVWNKQYLCAFQGFNIGYLRWFVFTGQPREFTGPGANLPWRPHDVTTGTKPPEPEQESEKTETTETKIEHGIPPHWPPPAFVLSLSTNCYNVTCISRAILRIYVIVTASVEDMEKLNETKLFSFQICMKTVQFVYYIQSGEN